MARRRAKITGGAETRRSLAALSRAIDVPLGDAGRYALRPVAKDAAANVVQNGSVLTGELAKSIVVKKDGKRSRKLNPVLVVGPSAKSKAVKYAHLIEFGVKAHWQPRRKRYHPGAEAAPFLAPAFESNKAEAIRRFADRIGPAIAKRVAHLARRAKR